MKAERCNFGYQHQKNCEVSKDKDKTELICPSQGVKALSRDERR